MAHTKVKVVSIWWASIAKSPTIQHWVSIIVFIHLSHWSANAALTTHSNIHTGECKAIIKIRGVFEERNGERYLRVTAFDLKPTNIADFKLQLKGLFPDEQMSEFDLAQALISIGKLTFSFSLHSFRYDC